MDINFSIGRNYIEVFTGIKHLKLNSFLSYLAPRPKNIEKTRFFNGRVP
jgi:hypothetical protein